MRVLRPDLLSWWLVIPVLMACWLVHARLRGWFRFAIHPHAAGFSDVSRRSTWRSHAGVLGLSILAAAATVFALMRPQVLFAERVPQYERQDLVIMLDRSVSMRARDIAPSRFARATLELRNVVRQKPDGIDRLGLIGFADSSLVLSYLTGDSESLMFYLDWLDEDSSVLFGTNIGAALTSAMELASRDNRPSRKRFLLVSDGEDHGTELNAALDTARAAGFRVDCIGIGSDASVPIPLMPAGAPQRAPVASRPPQPVQYLIDDDGRRVMTKFNETTLVRIAAASGGRYVRSATGSELARALAQLAKDDRRIIGWRSSTDYHDVYPAALAVALIATAALALLI
jgi:Ca-activated chloride channel family protein